MARFEITSPDGKRFEINAPEGVSADQVMAFAQSQFVPDAPKVQPKISTTEGIPASQLMLEGVGQGMTNVGRGIAQRLGFLSEADIADRRKWDAPLEESGAAKFGSVAGNLALLAPAMAIPGANTVAGAGVIGALSGAVQPTVAGESALRNAGVGAVLGAGAQYGLGKAASYAGSKLAGAEAKGAADEAQNAVRDATLKESQNVGYVVPPSQSGGGILPRVLEGVSGKYKTNQAAAIKNQNVTDSLARKSLGLAEDVPLTADTMKAVRANAYQTGYAPVRSIPEITPDATFKAQVQSLSSRADNAAKDFGELAASDVKPLVDGLSNVKKFSGDTAVDQIAILREKAGDLYAQGNKTLGKAYRQAADAIEGQLERALASTGKDGAAALQSFRDARQLIAKTHSVENALVEGGGRVNAKMLAAALQKGKPLSGDLKMIGSFANNFKDVAGVPQSGWANPITALDAFQTAGMAGMGAGPMSLALPAARIGARSLILNPSFQRAAVGPSYGPGLMGKAIPKGLEKANELGAGLLAPLAYSNQ